MYLQSLQYNGGIPKISYNTGKEQVIMHNAGNIYGKVRKLEKLEVFRTLPVSARNYAERRNKMRHYE